MEMPRYEFNHNIRDDLLQFLKVTNISKNQKYCDLEEYKKLKILFPLSKDIKENLKDTIIDISNDDEAEQVGDSILNRNNVEIEGLDSNLLNLMKNHEECDIADQIKDCLSMQNEVPKFILNDLSNLSTSELEHVFISLIPKFHIEDTKLFWNSLHNNNIGENIILAYVRFLFLPKLQEEFKYEFQSIFSILSQQYFALLQNELVKQFLKIELNQKVLIQYVSTLDNHFKLSLLRNFISTCNKLHQNYIQVIEALLVPQIDEDIQNKLIELMSNAAAEFSNDNLYGKLLFNILSSTDKYAPQLEQSLKHILSLHRSIWKLKIQTVVNFPNETLTLSFR